VYTLTLVYTLVKAAHGTSTSLGERMLAMPNWAVVGDVTNPTKPAAKVLQRLRDAGKVAVGVNPRDRSATLCRTLAEVTPHIDVVDLIINPRLGISVVEEAASLGITHVFIQPGASSEEIEAYCEASGMHMHHGCVLRELG
jgi:predicted CoA-binding protein